MSTTSGALRTAATAPVSPRTRGRRAISVVPDEPWLTAAVVAMSFQRADGEWRYCPWLIAGRDDLYDDLTR